MKVLFKSTEQSVGSILKLQILLFVLACLGFHLTVLSQYAGPEQYHIADAAYRVKEARKQLYSKNGRHPDNDEIAEATGLSLKRLMTILLTPKAPRSLDQKTGIDQTLKPSEVTADPEAETPEDVLMKQLMKKDLEKVLDSLNSREKQVIRSRFGLDDGRMKTLQEIGESMGVTRERIRQIESCAFRKLKNKKRIENLKQYLIS